MKMLLTAGFLSWLLLAWLFSTDVLAKTEEATGIRPGSTTVPQLQLGVTAGWSDPQDHRITVVSDKQADKRTTTCPVWTIPRGNATCECGSSVGGIVDCDPISLESSILGCYCMTYDASKGNTVVGSCFLTCYKYPSFAIPTNVTNLNQVMCNESNRDGQLCGGCKEGFAPPVYSYYMSCVRCTEDDNNILKYLAISLLPLTFSYILVILISFSATSPSMVALVLVSHIIASPTALRVDIADFKTLRAPEWQWILLHVSASVFGIWSLDFFRTVYSPFCLHPKMSTLQVLALDYIVAVYPLFLTVVTYFLVKLYDSNYRLVVWAWKPFRYCLSHFRAQWDIRTSLIDAFATFLILSSVKLLCVSADILVPTYIYNEHGNRVSSVYLYYDGTIEYFGKEHLPYALLALGILLACFFAPLILLFLYPCRCFQRILNRCRLRCVALHTFMDAFQGCYKDGTNGTRDCRYFAGACLLMRFVLLVIYALTRGPTYYPAATLILITLAASVAVIRPYKADIFNAVDPVLILVGCCILYFNYGYSSKDSRHMLQSSRGGAGFMSRDYVYVRGGGPSTMVL